MKPMLRLLGVPVLASLLLLSTSESAGIAATTPMLKEGLFNPVSIDQNKTRIFMPLRNVKIRETSSKVTSWNLEVSSDSPSVYTLERAVNSGVLHHLRIQSLEGKTYIHADWRYAAPVEVNVRSGGLEIFFLHRKAETHWRTIQPGVKYWEGQRWTSAGPMRVRALRLDPRRIRLAPALANAGTSQMGLSTVSRLATNYGAIAGINGSFFSPKTGQPQGTLVMNHNLVSRTMLDRPGLWLECNGNACIKTEKPMASIRVSNGSHINCQAVNEAAGRDRVVLFTTHHGRTTHTIPDDSRVELAISATGKVVAEGTGNLDIPRDGYVVSGQGAGASALKKALAFGHALKVQFSMRPEITDALGGGPTLLQDGLVRVMARQQHFRSDIAYGRAPRTAIGLTDDHKYILVCVDGRQPGYSQGATLTELAWLMKDLGSKEALNLDGGGSTTMWMHGHTLNRPSDGTERAVSTALLVLPRTIEKGSIGFERLLANEIKF
jgi:exopolysaccharide biosynthesis protein